MELNELQKALLWFENNGFEAYSADNSSIYLVVNGLHIQISTSEIIFRAESWDWDNNN